jgi:hypothetical protein
MIIPQYFIADSEINSAGKGFFLNEVVSKASVVVAPDNINSIFSYQGLQQFDKNSVEYLSYVRWFENHFTICPEWSDECYINHSSTPTGLYHLGFVFAYDNWPSGTELTIDYALLTHDNEALDFKDSQTDKPVMGLSWKEAFTRSTKDLLRIITE